MTETRDKFLTAGPARKGPKITMRCERAHRRRNLPSTSPPRPVRVPGGALGPLLKSILQKFARWDCGHEAHSSCGRSRYRRGDGPGMLRATSSGPAWCLVSPAGPLMAKGRRWLVPFGSGRARTRTSCLVPTSGHPSHHGSPHKSSIPTRGAILRSKTNASVTVKRTRPCRGCSTKTSPSKKCHPSRL
jgi:hypothetical protein